MTADQREDQEDKSEGRDDLPKHVRWACAVMRGDADGAQAEHRVGDHGADAAASDLCRDVGTSVTPGEPAEGGVDE